jgi:hypothetical protein
VVDSFREYELERVGSTLAIQRKGRFGKRRCVGMVADKAQWELFANGIRAGMSDDAALGAATWHLRPETL